MEQRGRCTDLMLDGMQGGSNEAQKLNLPLADFLEELTLGELHLTRDPDTGREEILDSLWDVIKPE